MIKNICFSVLFFFFAIRINAQDNTPKREFRAAWIATVSNIDWPSKAGLDAEVQKQEFINIINKLKANNMNAVIVQIRPAADALYSSPYENWSRYLSGKQGVAPSPYYDPLAFMVEECHKRCLEFHAWFNPYRALIDASKNPNTPDHITYQHPEWFVNYGGKKYFDPGLPEVRAYFTKIVLDVVKRYDIDAVHFDDYFYPYRIAKQEFPDYKSYTKYGIGFSTKDDWRRDNVNKLIEQLSTAIKKEKTYVKFGISPFGVWRNSSKDPEGSNTRGGQTNYDDLFADVLLWQKKGWVDYMLPQLYWEIGHKAVDYSTLLDWWAEHAYGRHMYIGHGVYRLASDPKPCWKNLTEIETQINQLRKNENVSGSAFYSANTFIKNTYGINETMKSRWYTNPALLPAMPWLKHAPLPTPKVTLTHDGNANYKLNWTTSPADNSDFQYAVYRFETKENADISSGKNLIAITRNTYYNDTNTSGKKYKYIVTSLDRLHNESEGSVVVY